jgi:hypothetical protein
MSVYGMSRVVATSMGSTTTTAVSGTRLCCSLRVELYYRSGAASTSRDDDIRYAIVPISFLIYYATWWPDR